MKIVRLILLILFVLPAMVLFAKDKTSVSIRAQATVMDQSGIELVTIKNMDIDMGMANNGKIYVSAHNDPQAALIMVKGRADARFRITFAPVVEIANTTGTGVLLLHYELYGYSKENQSASEPIDATERTLQISSDGKYFFWIGGRMDISNARPGNYDGDFTIEIEYF